jgi:hypothetical protein
MEVRQEEDLLPGRALTLLAASAVLLAVALSAWAFFIMAGSERRLRPSGVFLERTLPTPSEVSAIEQEPFTAQSPSVRQRRAAERQLSTYGWVDRERRLVHIPIERAIEHYVAEGAGR